MNLPTYQKMLEASLHMGHIASRWEPHFAPFILDKRNNRHIINLRKTHEALTEAIQKMGPILQQGGNILFIGTKKQAQQPVQNAAEVLKCPYITERWLGGTLTNFGTIYNSIKKFSKMDHLEEDITYKNSTKKEQLKMRTKRQKLKRDISGLRSLKRVPQALFIIDVKKELTAVKEAQKIGIPIFAIVDSNANPDLVDVAIPANDDSKKGIELLLEYMVEALKPSVALWEQNKNQSTNTAPATAPPKEKTKSKAASAPTPKPTPEKMVKKEETPKAASNISKDATKKTEESSKDPAEVKQLVQKLRKQTGSGLMECLKALKNNDFHFEKAVGELAIRAKKKAEKLSKNPVEEHFVFAGVDKANKRGTIIQLSCQTDFVGNNEQYEQLAQEIINVALTEKPDGIEKLLSLNLADQDNPEETIQDKLNFNIACFGENILITDYQQLEGEYITASVHPNKKSGTLLETNKVIKKDKEGKSPQKQVAMQIFIKKPMGITVEEVVNKLQEGGKKIPNVEKIAEGKALLSQPFYQNEEISVADYLKENAPELEVKSYIRAPQSKK